MPVINTECAAHKKSCHETLVVYKSPAVVKSPRPLAAAHTDGAATSRPLCNLPCKEPAVLIELPGSTNQTPHVNCPCCANEPLPLVLTLTLRVFTRSLRLSDP